MIPTGRLQSKINETHASEELRLEPVYDRHGRLGPAKQRTGFLLQPSFSDAFGKLLSEDCGVVNRRCRRLAATYVEKRHAIAKTADRKRANSTSPAPNSELMSCGGRYAAVARANRKQETTARHSVEHAQGHRRRTSPKRPRDAFVPPEPVGGEYGLLPAAVTPRSPSWFISKLSDHERQKSAGLPPTE